MNPKTKGCEKLMQLLTKELRKQLPPLYFQKNEKDPMVYIKYFDPVGSWTWYVIEGEGREDNFLFFGLVIGFEAELGYFTLNELQTAKSGATGIRAMSIERDLYFTPCKLSKVKGQHNREHGTQI